MPDLKIHTTIRSRYQVFDASGRLPFSIAFGLCRHSSADVDPRPLTLSTKQSVFDVPYALANELLELHEDTNTGDEVLAELGDLETDTTGAGQCITLPSPVGRSDNWRKAFTTVLYDVQPSSALASRLQTGKTYTIQMRGLDLGVKWWMYGDSSSQPPQSPGPQNLINQKSAAGKATFRVVPSLPWPPKTETNLSFHSVNSDGEVIMEVSTVNTSDVPVTVQTRGHQRFLTPSTSFPHPEENDVADYRLRLIDIASERDTPSALQVIDQASGAVVYQTPMPKSAPLTQGHDPRPRSQDLIALKPGEPVVRHVNVSSLLKRVPDGRYAVRIAPKGMWWCEGLLEDVVEEDGDRVRREKWNATIAPLMLESENVVEVQVQDGRGKAPSDSEMVR